MSKSNRAAVRVQGDNRGGAHHDRRNAGASDCDGVDDRPGPFRCTRGRARFIRGQDDGFRGGIADAEFAGLGKKVSEGFEAVDWKDVTALVRKPGDTSPEAIAFIGSVLRKQGLKAD
ncbi:MAG TPA: hypothetical protein VFK79_13745 [Xanthobacteraceae bacterium]|nr:hypothetical protein [Xanthobacteraceae bacterium]